MRHIIRDPRTLIIVFVMPVVMVLLFGYALNMDVEHIPIGIIDYDNTPLSREIIRDFSASEYFDIESYLSDAGEIESLFQKRKIKAAFVIPEGFGESRNNNMESQLQLLVDGSDPTFGNATVNFSEGIITTTTFENITAQNSIPVEIRERFLYNPDMEGAAFIIPGLVAVILMMLCALLTSITISREKETGTMDVLLVSPVRPMEIFAGKVIPYIGLALLDAVFVLVFAKVVFNFPFKGDIELLLAFGILFIYCALGIGLFISSIAPTQQIAMMAALITTIMPSILLSGFIFPIFSMPVLIRTITYIVPAKYFMNIIRGILLKSSSFDILKGQALFLFLLGTFFVTIATVRFKTRIKR
jgi:ABC-2 type transport system permease protein